MFAFKNRDHQSINSLSIADMIHSKIKILTIQRIIRKKNFSMIY